MPVLSETDRYHHRKKPDFSLTIVNIVLLLIFFFLISGTLTETKEWDLDLTDTSTLPLDQLPKPLLLVRQGGRLELAGKSVTIENLAADVNNLSGDSVLHLLVDKRVSANDVLSLMATPGLENQTIKLVTLHKRVEP